jgi:hypothetical protein
MALPLLLLRIHTSFSEKEAKTFQAIRNCKASFKSPIFLGEQMKAKCRICKVEIQSQSQGAVVFRAYRRSSATYVRIYLCRKCIPNRAAEEWLEERFSVILFTRQEIHSGRMQALARKAKEIH